MMIFSGENPVQAIASTECPIERREPAPRGGVQRFDDGRSSTNTAGPFQRKCAGRSFVATPFHRHS